MNNYCFTCVVKERRCTVISEYEVHETMAEMGIPLCPKHYVRSFQARLTKRRQGQEKSGYLDQLRAEGGA